MIDAKTIGLEISIGTYDDGSTWIFAGPKGGAGAVLWADRSEPVRLRGAPVARQGVDLRPVDPDGRHRLVGTWSPPFEPEGK